MLNKMEASVKPQIPDSGADTLLPVAQMTWLDLTAEYLAKVDDRDGCENRSRIRRGERKGGQRLESRGGEGGERDANSTPAKRRESHDRFP